MEEIETELAALSELREKPAGTIRLSATDYAADTILWPKLSRFLPNYPDIKVEINVNYGLIGIVAERYDAGARFPCSEIAPISLNAAESECRCWFSADDNELSERNQ
jgi:DNA-binding transcriptional LysR family regulator